ncbi:MAG: class I SAM-dependent methyltransferase [Parachlamydiaceae bacterium]
MLKISNEQAKDEEKTHFSPRKLKRQQTEACFEREWLKNDQQFNPKRNCMELERLDRTMNLLNKYCDVKGKRTVDLGSGFGVLAKRVRDLGAQVDAVDIANNALQHIKNERAVTAIQDFVPYTRLEDERYDLVLSTELIAYLPKEDYRLFFSELARLVHTEGWIICSTPLDIYSVDALERFASFAETELEIKEWIFSYHYLWIKIHQLINKPKKYLKAAKDPHYRKEELKKLRGIKQWWFSLKTSALSIFIWLPIRWLTTPLSRWIGNHKNSLVFLEKISKSLWQEQAISHAIVIAKRKPLFKAPSENELPVERKGKKIIWE